MADGHCHGHPEWTHLFYPERGENEKAEEARAICLFCPVNHECLDYAFTWHLNTDIDGIMAGYTNRQRRKIPLEELHRGLDRVHPNTRSDLAS